MSDHQAEARAGPSDPSKRPKSNVNHTQDVESNGAMGDESMAATGGNVSDDSEDEVADFRMLLPQLLSDNKSKSQSTGSLPKRGEKDFEPTGFKGQEKKLQESRKAMEMVIGQQRRTGSKALSKAIWYPHLNRAVVTSSQGTTIASLGVTTRVPVVVSSAAEIPSNSLDVLGPNNQVGVWKAGIFYPRYNTRLDLYPEEVLFLLERGSLDCRMEMKLADSSSEEIVQIPLSLQHAFSLMIGKDGCTRERYQTYTYLKRLGYYVQRAEVTDSLRKKAAKNKEAEEDYSIPTPGASAGSRGIIADPKKPLKLVTIWDLLLYIPRRIIQIVSTAMRSLLARLKAQSSSRNVSSVGLQPGRGLLGLGGKRFDWYDSVYSALQIIPSGHDTHKPTTTITPESNPFRAFYNAWRPATHFKKTNPPVPEYRIAVVGARDTCLPKLSEFADVFNSIPMNLSEELSEEELQRAMEGKKRNDESYGRGFLAKKRMNDIRAAREQSKQGKGKDTTTSTEKKETSSNTPQSPSLLSRLLSRLLRLYLTFNNLFKHLPPGCTSSIIAPLPYKGRPRGQGAGAGRRPNPFPPLKAGRRDIILAIVDHGTSSLVRFGEAEFEKWKLMG
ncbi:unnamed protein product [Sympodiomycopsis kandeliae]